MHRHNRNDSIDIFTCTQAICFDALPFLQRYHTSTPARNIRNHITAQVFAHYSNMVTWLFRVGYRTCAWKIDVCTNWTIRSHTQKQFHCLYHSPFLCYILFKQTNDYPYIYHDNAAKNKTKSFKNMSVRRKSKLSKNNWESVKATQ